MDRITYQDRMDSLVYRYRNAQKNKCVRTARARVRDMAKLYAEYSGKSYSESLMQIEKSLVR